MDKVRVLARSTNWLWVSPNEAVVEVETWGPSCCLELLLPPMWYFRKVLQKRNDILSLDRVVKMHGTGWLTQQ